MTAVGTGTVGDSISLTTARLRVRDNLAADSPIVTTLDAGAEVQVLETGWTNADNTLGRILLVASGDGMGIYMLAHLSGFAPGIQRGADIEPNQTVAYVGGSGNQTDNFWNTGRGSGPHLHLEYYQQDKGNPYDLTLINTEDNQCVTILSILSIPRLNPPRVLTLRRASASPIYQARRRNPFVHADPHLLPRTL